MRTAKDYYAVPANRKCALETARGTSPIGGAWGITRRMKLGDGGGTWQTDPRTGERTGAYFCDRFPDDWRELARPKGRYGYGRDGICDWYSDTFQNGVVRPHVLQLPARRGEVLYVPATDRDDCDGVTLYLGDVIRGESGGDADTPEAIRDAWNRANRCAELEAAVSAAARSVASLMLEHAREDFERDQAEQECERLREESAKLLAQILADREALAAFPFAEQAEQGGAHKRAAEALEQRIETARAERSANFARRRELRACPRRVAEER